MTCDVCVLQEGEEGDRCMDKVSKGNGREGREGRRGKGRGGREGEDMVGQHVCNG